MFAGFPRGALWVAAAYLALFATVRLHGPAHPDERGDAGSRTPMATPPGVTLQVRANVARSRVETAPQIVLADASGMTLYTRDANAAMDGAWTAAVAPSAAKPEGDWSLRTDAGGIRQWIYRGAPLYRYAGDKAIGDTSGDGAGGAWHAVLFHPGSGISLPDGIAVGEIPDAGGVGLVDGDGLTLYVFDGDPMQGGPTCGADADCARLWRPLEAGAMANPTGQFSALARIDGVTQWTYRRRPVYRFDGDRKPGEANGAGDSRVSVALIARYFMPAGVSIRRTIDLGAILTTSGAALYQRDRVTSEELHEFRIDHGTPALGRSLGTASCNAACAGTWPPFRAPADAVPSGYWDVLERSDGTRQWAFKGFAMYTYSEDAPGQIKGNGIYDLARTGGDAAFPGTDARPPAGEEAPGLGLGAMFWHAVVP
jgi:predicted lipoprotein with Yx(FWY)xxD motif